MKGYVYLGLSIQREVKRSTRYLEVITLLGKVKNLKLEKNKQKWPEGNEESKKLDNFVREELTLFNNHRN